MQLDIFSELEIPQLKINDDVFLIEFFGGVGSQCKAIKKSGFNIVKSTLYEVDIDASISYASVHHNLNEVLEIEKTQSKEFYLNHLNKFTWWKNDKEYDINKYNEDKLKVLYHSQILSNNKTNIFELDVDALDQEIKEAKQNGLSVIITWSTPCQEFSMAGNRGGFDTYKGSLTGVSLDIFERLVNKPDILLFENVPGIKSGKFESGFKNMYNKIRDIGYTNNIMKLNAKYFEIPQNRDRIFILSTLQDMMKFNYEIPKPFPLTIKLKDLLEDEVDASYFLSQEQIDKIVFKESGNELGYVEKGTGKHQSNTIYNSEKETPTLINVPVLEKIGYVSSDKQANQIYTDDVARTQVANAGGGGAKTGLYLVDTEKSDNFMQGKSRIRESDVSATIRTKIGGNDESLMIKSDVKCGYEVARDGDGIYINRPHQKRGVVQTDMIQTIKTSPDVGVILYNNSTFNVRKLTPLECWRLMGFDDVDYYNASKHMSKTALYKQAGNSIVVNVLDAIFSSLKK